MKNIDYRKLCHPDHPEFRLAISPFYLMSHADFDYHEEMSKALEKHGVNRSMYRIMTVLREHDSANIGFLAERALIKRNTASRIVERMTKKELVTVFPNPNDSRVTEVVLTQRGKKLLDSLTPIVGRIFQHAIDGIGDEELANFILALQKITGNLNRLLIEVPAKAPADGPMRVVSLPAGQAWAASANGPAGSTTICRLEVSEGRGRGVRLLNEPTTASLRATVKAAKDYLYLHATDLLGSRDPKSREFIVAVHSLDGGKVGGCSAVGLVLAVCSALVTRRLRDGLVIVGELAQGAVQPLKAPAEFVETAVRDGARAILLPVSCRRALADVSDEIATGIEMVFYANVHDAFTKAVHV
jgi:MarR family transcriptional regulator, organic hydroperoxide resistance regulator